MIIYLILAGVLFNSYRKKKELIKEDATREFKDSFLKVTLYASLFFFMASLTTFIEFILKRQSKILNIMMILIGALILSFIIVGEYKNYLVQREKTKKSVEDNKKRYSILHLPKNSVRKYLKENKITLSDSKKKPKLLENGLFPGEDEEIPR